MRDRGQLIEQLLVLAPALAREEVTEYCARMDDDYFALFPAETVAQHLALASSLAMERPVAVRFEPQAASESRITIVAYDYFGEFAVVCGLIASFSLDIRAGQVFTFLPSSDAATPSTRRGPRPQHRRSATKIVDIFDVKSTGDVPFDSERQAAFAVELRALAALWARGASDEARDRINLRLVETLEGARAQLTGVLYPVEVAFDNESTERWTVMDVNAQDTPAFLYTFANALALRGVYIHRVEIGGGDGEARDRFFIADRQGGKIADQERQATLRLAVGLIKQFTHFLAQAPNPADALKSFDQLFDTVMEASAQGRGLDLFTRRENLALLAQLLGSSRFLWEDFLRMQLPNLLPLIEGLRTEEIPQGREGFDAALARLLAPVDDGGQRKRILNEFKDRMMFLIDLRQLDAGREDVGAFSRSLTDLAEVVIEHACSISSAALRMRHGVPRLPDGAECALAVCALGKFGGGELGYASDIELLFVYTGPGETDGIERIQNGAYFDALVRALTELIESRQHGIFEIDLRLRPYGRKGPMATDLAGMGQYYGESDGAAPFERQALVKLRFVAGDRVLGRVVEELRDRLVYSPAPFDLSEARRLRERQMRELVKVGEVSVKHSAGGLIDIEYGVQYLQVLEGHRLPRIRTPNTLLAIERLVECGLLGADEARAVSAAYLFLRRLIDGLRMVRGNAKDLVLPARQTDEMRFLARRLGYGGASWDAAAERLAADIQRHMEVSRVFYGRYCGAVG